MTVTYHAHFQQGSEEWHRARCGLLTASEMHHIITPTLKHANNDKSRSHINEILAQRISEYVEAAYVSDDMLRGQQDEMDARAIYHEKIAPVREIGFVTNNKWGFTIGCSPDGLVGSDGVIECKGRRQKFQVDTIVQDLIPEEYLIQVQTILLVTERPWADFVSYSPGLPMVVIREDADAHVQDKIIAAATYFEEVVAHKLEIYKHNAAKLIPTKRREESELMKAWGDQRKAFMPDALMAG